MLTIVCVHVGQKYGQEYVRRLYKAVQRHLQLPHRFVCLTDAPDLYRDAPFAVRQECSGYSGYWAKTGLFHPKNGLTGRVLYLDIDTLIVADLMPLLQGKLCKHDGFWMREDWITKSYSSAVMLFTAGKYDALWRNFSWRQKGMFPGDQDYLTAELQRIGETVQPFDPRQIVSYKLDGCTDKPPKGARLVCFHGYPPLHEVGGWARGMWTGA